MLKLEHKIYLERLRRSGITNMYGATPHIAHRFNINTKTAAKILIEWMETYDPKDEAYKNLE